MIGVNTRKVVSSNSRKKGGRQVVSASSGRSDSRLEAIEHRSSGRPSAPAASRVRLKGFSYREIEKLLKVSTSFIAQTHRKYLGGIARLKLKYQGSKSYLTK
jgi:hypothetical protein